MDLEFTGAWKNDPNDLYADSCWQQLQNKMAAGWYTRVDVPAYQWAFQTLCNKVLNISKHDNTQITS